MKTSNVFRFNRKVPGLILCETVWGNWNYCLNIATKPWCSALFSLQEQVLIILRLFVL